MRSTTRFIALGLAAVMLAACKHKNKDAPLAFVPADTPYVIANLDVLDAGTRKAMLAQADAQLPSQLANLDATANELSAKDPGAARLLRALSAEFSGKTIESFAKNTGINLEGYWAMYGLGLAPVMRFDLSDPKAFDAFIGRLETAYGKPLDAAKLGDQGYRRYVSTVSGTQVILALVGKQAVAALLPADASPAMLRQTLGLDRPQKNLQDDGRLDALAKAKGYKKYMVGDIDMTRLLPLALGGTDPLVEALRKARAEAESAKTGEPVANQLQTPAACSTEAARIAARMPTVSFGYTELDAKEQSARFDVALASDISQAFSTLKINLPGLGSSGGAPFDLSLGLPVASLRTFWMAQADAVAAKPFTCPALTDINDTFAKLGPVLQKTAVPPFGNLLGLRIALDSIIPATGASSIPGFTGRLVVASSDPAGLLAMGQMMVPALAQLKLTADGAPQPVPQAMTGMLGQPAWLAMSANALALGIGAGEQAKLADTLKEPVGEAGQMSRMNLSGAMYLSWLNLMEQKASALTTAAATLSHSDPANPAAAASTAPPAADLARTQAQFSAMKAQAERISEIGVETHFDSSGMVITSQTKLK